MKVDQLGHIKLPSPQEVSMPPRVLVAAAGGPSGVAAIRALDSETLDIFSADIGFVPVFDPSLADEGPLGVEYSLSTLDIQVKETADGERVSLKVSPYFSATMPPAPASGVSMLKLCVDGVLADD